ncbi:MAG: hypothetical protein WB554_05295 [Desulfomonilaceae bacterium]
MINLVKELTSKGYSINGITNYLDENGYSNRRGNRFEVKEVGGYEKPHMTLQEELEALRNDPDTHALLRKLKDQSDERNEILISELTNEEEKYRSRRFGQAEKRAIRVNRL